jgi:hypothetical protein
MTKQSKRQPKNVTTTSKPTCSHHIACSGTHGAVRALPHSEEAPRAQSPIFLAEPIAIREREAINRIVEAQLEQDFQEELQAWAAPSAEAETQADGLRAELEAKIDNTIEVLTKQKASGDVRLSGCIQLLTKTLCRGRMLCFGIGWLVFHPSS